MSKFSNKHRHKWVEPFDSPFTYICSRCGKHRIKETMYTATYYDENMNPLGSKSPECVSKIDERLKRFSELSGELIKLFMSADSELRSYMCGALSALIKEFNPLNKMK